MCGIIAYCGEEQAQPILLDGLQKLEYRGYDSVGIACQSEASESGSFVLHKEVGKVEDLVRLCQEHRLAGRSGIGHCRWATHGAVTWANAHPHYSSDNQVVLVHNGIIENYRELRRFLEGEGMAFQSEGDTETVANLLAYLLQVCQGHSLSPAAAEVSSEARLYGREGDEAVLRVLQSLRYWLKGAYALAIMFASQPDEIFALCCENPLVIGLGPEGQGNYFASDVLPILEYTKNIVYLQNHEIARICRQPAQKSGGMQLYDASAQPLQAQIQQLEGGAEVIDKQGYEHFMAKEIHEQPQIFRELFQRYVNRETWQLSFDLNEEQQQKLRDCHQIIIVSCGTSYHSSVYARYILEKYCDIPVRIEYASEFRYRKPALHPRHTVVIGLSQSGETADTLAALKMARKLGATTLALVNVSSSSMARLVDILLCSYCGPEIGVASTKVYTAQLLILYYFSFYMAQLHGLDRPATTAEKLQRSQKLSVVAERILSKAGQLRELGRAYAGYQHMLYLGRSLYYPLALEGALKLKELSYIHAEGYAAAEMKHGPIALIDNRMPIVVLSPGYGVLYEKMQSNIAEAKARGGRILGFICEEEAQKMSAAPSKGKALYNDTFSVPQVSEELDVLLYAIPLQLFAYYIALAKDIDPDQPRNLAKSVTVE